VADPDSSQIVFEQFQQPGLKDGQHTVTVSVSVKDPSAPTFQPVRKVLQVTTDGRSLPPGSVNSVFPPENASGDYTGCLPHVVLSRPTLPWQKELKPGASEATPWLAVLLLTDAELHAENGAVVSRVTQQGSTITILTMPVAFFQAMAPTLGELSYLAHVRKVETARKADATVDEVDYALVIGNRLPPPGTGSNAFLVSLAGLGDQLAGGTGAAPNTGQVQVTVLHSWRFFTVAESRTFADVISALNHNPPTLGLPFNASAGGAADNLLAMGYVPMRHALRVGGQTVSWYRGPLVPYGTRRQIPTLPIPWADAVCFYDPTIGLMDVSCSAAWTLGRLLALNAGSFATALYNWKRATQRATIDRVIYELDTGLPAPAGSPAAARRQRAEGRLAAFLPSALARLGGFTAKPAPISQSAPGRGKRPVLPRAERAVALRKAMTNPAKIAAVHGLSAHQTAAADGNGDPMLADNVAQIWSWLGDLNLLKGVPFFYLAPDQRMLPTEAIRFFQVDAAWMEALIDGALSIGRVTAADASHDAAFRPMWKHGTAKAAASARRRRRQSLADDNLYPLPPARPASGFLLRSSAVTHWPGLEVDASGPSGPAIILRMEATGTLLVCLFDRVVDTVRLHQPSEGVHFGFDATGGTLSKKRRRLQPEGNNPAGSELDTNPLTSVPYRDPATGVLDIAALATWFANSFNPAPAQFTSAEFALEMVTGVELVTFSITS